MVILHLLSVHHVTRSVLVAGERGAGGRRGFAVSRVGVLDTAKPLLLQSIRFMGTESINKIQVHETVFQIE